MSLKSRLLNFLGFAIRVSQPRVLDLSAQIAVSNFCFTILNHSSSVIFPAGCIHSTFRWKRQNFMDDVHYSANFWKLGTEWSWEEKILIDANAWKLAQGGLSVNKRQTTFWQFFEKLGFLSGQKMFKRRNLFVNTLSAIDEPINMRILRWTKLQRNGQRTRFVIR